MNKLATISIFLLVLALFKLPYGYYTLLRLFLFITSCCYLYNNSKQKSNLFYGWLILGLIYNPIIPIYLGRDIWQVINILSILFILFWIYKLNGGKK